MVAVDFYLVENSENKERAICKLIANLYQAKHQVYVFASSLKEAQFYDELLWTFEEDSFIPHQLIDEGLKPPPPIQLGFGPQIPLVKDVLFNLHSEIPSFYRVFQRIIEVVPNDETGRELSRQHYRFYQQQGFKVSTHQFTKAENPL